MKFGSVCSGIEAASVAWQPLGWRAAFLSEIEPFPCAVLAHHYPDVPNHGDMTTFMDWPDANLDVLCGGTPCQSFSVAGLRKGLDDPRGNLMLTFGAIAARYRPKWLVWENVPGVLSSNGGRDFGAFLGLLGVLGYGFAYRVLDAQYFGLAQRRKRVFVVGCLGDWRSAAAVLFERNSLSGHPAPSRQTWKDIAGSLGASSGRRNMSGIEEAAGGQLIPEKARALTTSNQRIDVETETFIVADTLTVGANQTFGFVGEAIAHALTGEGFDAIEDGTGRGTPLVSVLPFDTTQMTSAANRSQPKAGDPCHPLAAGAHPPAIAFSAKDYGGDASLELSPTLRAGTHSGSHANAGVMPAIAFNWQGGGKQTTLGYGAESRTAGTLVKDQTQAVVGGMQVRRLTPRECARLQGFPDDYLDIIVRGKPAADGPKYKALGNSWAVPNVRWIGRRIEAVESISKFVEAA